MKGHSYFKPAISVLYYASTLFVIICEGTYTRILNLLYPYGGVTTIGCPSWEGRIDVVRVAPKQYFQICSYSSNSISIQIFRSATNVRDVEPKQMFVKLTGEFVGLFCVYFIKHCFISRPSDSTVSEEAEDVWKVPFSCFKQIIIFTSVLNHFSLHT